MVIQSQQLQLYLIHFLERKWGVFYSMGGTGALINALQKLMLEEKIKINLNSDVKKILIKDNKAEGIEVNNKKIYADKIVLNTDPAFTYKG